MIVVALVLASIASGPVGPGRVVLVPTETTQVTFTIRDREPSASVSGEVIDETPRPTQHLSHDFVLRGRSEVDPKGWAQAMSALDGDGANKIGLAHAMNLAAGQARDPMPFHVVAREMSAGNYQDTEFGLRAFDLNVLGSGAPIRVARYWYPEARPINEWPVMTSGYRLPNGSERTWSYRDGGWRLDTPKGPVETMGTPPEISVERRGIDLNNVRYRIRNNTDDTVAGAVLPGQVLVPDDPEVQRMVTISRERFTVPPGGQIELDVRVACLDIDKHEPTSMTNFRVVPNQDPVLANLLNLTADAPLLGPWNQAMIWIHTNGASMERINNRLGRGVAPIQYQHSAAQVAMYGGLDPMDARNEPVFRSLANPTSILMGMQEFPGLTSLLAPNLGSGGGGAMLREAVGQVPGLVAGLNLSDAQQESLSKTCSTLLLSGDPSLTLSALRVTADLRKRYPGFENRTEVHAGLEFARCSPDSGVRTAAWMPEAVPAGAWGTLFNLAQCLRSAEKTVRVAGASTVPGIPDEASAPRGFRIELGDVPVSVKAGDPISLRINPSSGTVLSVAYGFQRRPAESSKSVANVEKGGPHTWKPDVKAPAVLQLRARAVSTDGQIAYATTSVLIQSPVALNVRSDLADALRRGRDAQARRGRALAEADRGRQEYERIAQTLRKHWSDLKALQSADRELLDGLEAQFKLPIDQLLARNKALDGGAPPAQGDVDKAAEDARKAADDCEKELDELNKQKADAEKERDAQQKEISDTLDAISDIYTGAGFTGGTGNHSDGSGWFGFVGEGAGLPSAADRQVSNLTKQLHAANKKLAAAKKRAKDLDAKIKAKQKECEDLKKRNAEAQKAKADKDEVAANNAQIGQAWDGISQKLKDLQDRLSGIEGGAGLAGEAGALGGAMPTDQAGWDRFWQRLRDLIARKKQLESQLESKIRAAQDQARAARAAAEKAEQDARDAQRDAERAASEAAARQEAINKQPPPPGGAPDPPPPLGQVDPCMEKFATWLKKYQDRMTKTQLQQLNDMMKGALEKAQIPGAAVGEAIAGGAQALAKGAGGAAAGLNALASGFLSLGAGLFYAYAQSEIAAALGPLGSKIRLQRVAALAAGSKDPCGEVGQGGATGTGLESFFYFRVGDKLIVFRGGADGVELVGVGAAI